MLSQFTFVGRAFIPEGGAEVGKGEGKYYSSHCFGKMAEIRANPALIKANSKLPNFSHAITDAKIMVGTPTALTATTLADIKILFVE